MNRNEAAVVLLALGLAALPPVSAQSPSAPRAPSGNPVAQTPPAGTSAPTMSSDAQPSNRAPLDASADADARHCLELATNNEVIACAEKYRSHKARK